MIEPQILGRDLDEIRTIVAMWQEALGLDEWSIDVELIEARQMPEQAAACAFTAARREAKIRLAMDIDSDEELHNCIAHELMHLHFWWITDEAGVESELLEYVFERVCLLMARMHLQARTIKKKTNGGRSRK